MSVAVVVTTESEAPALCRWGWWIARAREEDLLLLWMPPAGLETGSRLRPAEGLPEGLSETLAAVCRELTPPARVTRETEPAPEVQSETRALADPPIEVHLKPVPVSSAFRYFRECLLDDL